MRCREDEGRRNQNAGTPAQSAVAEISLDVADGAERKAGGVRLLYTVVCRADDRVIGRLRKADKVVRVGRPRDHHVSVLSDAGLGLTAPGDRSGFLLPSIGVSAFCFCITSPSA